MATSLGAGFVPARKPGKLPWERVTEAYDLEYGTDALECHRDGLPAPARVLIVDDVLATGGTARAAGQLARGLGAELVGWSFLLEIAGLGGTEKLTGGRDPRRGPPLRGSGTAGFRGVVHGVTIPAGSGPSGGHGDLTGYMKSSW